MTNNGEVKSENSDFDIEVIEMILDEDFLCVSRSRDDEVSLTMSWTFFFCE